MSEEKQFTRRGWLSTTAGSALTGVLLQKGIAGPGGTNEFDFLRAIFADPPASAAPMTRSWWFGGAITPQEITRELTFMREAGLRGVELHPVYPVSMQEPERGIQNTRYFSAKWYDLLRHAARECERLGLQFDLTLGRGWPYGGPFIPIELAAR